MANRIAGRNEDDYGRHSMQPILSANESSAKRFALSNPNYFNSSAGKRFQIGEAPSGLVDRGLNSLKGVTVIVKPNIKIEGFDDFLKAKAQQDFEKFESGMGFEVNE